ncbi:MAG: hypothetical protein EZS28_038232, partial [Streblomastix strix]
DDDDDQEQDDLDRDGDQDVISSVVHVEMKLIPIFPNRLGILPSIKIRKMLSVEEMQLQQTKGYLFKWKVNGREITNFRDLKSQQMKQLQGSYTKGSQTSQAQKKDTTQYPVEFSINPLYRPVRVQLLVFWAESDARITYPYVNQQELQMRESQKREETRKKKREFKALEAELNEIRQQGGQMNMARSGQNKQQTDLALRKQNIEADLEIRRAEIAKERRLRQKREEEHKLRDKLRAKKLPERLIVRARATDAKSEMVETQPASFTIETNPDMENTFMRDPTRGYFYEEFDIVTDERAPLVVSLIQQEIKESPFDSYTQRAQKKEFKEQSIQVNYDNNNHDVVTQGLNPNCYTNTTVSLLNTLNEQKRIYYQRRKQEEQERQERFLYGQDQYDNPTKGKKGDLLAPLTLVQLNQSSNSYKLNDQNQQKVTFSRSSSFYYDETALTTVAIPVFEAAKRQGEFYLVRYVDEERGYALCVGICVHHMKMVRRLFETPKVGMMMQMYLPLTQRNQAPYPPVCVTRVTGDCVAEWED